MNLAESDSEKQMIQCVLMQVHLMKYTSEVYPMLARRLKIWPFPRAHHYHLTVLPYRWELAIACSCIGNLHMYAGNVCSALGGPHRIKESVHAYTDV